MDELKKLRGEIDKIDEKLSKLLKKRVKIIKEISEHKRKNSIPTTNKNREEEIFSKLESDFEKNIFKKIIEESKKVQKGF